MSEPRDFESVVGLVLGFNRFLGRTWALHAERTLVAADLFDMLNAASEDPGAEWQQTGGMVIHRDAESGKTDVLLLVATRWDKDDTGEPEWT